MGKAEKRLASLKALLDDAHRRLGLEFGFRLWDGAVVPADWPSDALAIVIADEGAVASLIRAPRLPTLANLWAAKRLDIVNGDLFDLVAKRPKARTRDLRKGLNKLAALRTALAFLFVAARRALAAGERSARTARAAAPKPRTRRTSPITTTSPTPSIGSGSTRRWSTPAPIFTIGATVSTPRRRNKLDMICRKLRLQPGETMLDIGSGWGSLACHAARHYGVKVLGVTLSEQQIGYARDKVQRLGLADKVTFELVDYALLEGAERFDKISSVGMFEHIGVSHFATYFDTVHRLLKPGGLYLHHAITRPGKRAAVKGGKKRPEFAALTRYIFPGGELDYLGRTITNLEQHGFEVHDVEGWREHYQRTCRLWHDRLAGALRRGLPARSAKPRRASG